MRSGPLSRRGILLGGSGLALWMATRLGATSVVAPPLRMRQRPAKPIVLAHRGASALRPEHTLGSYAKAIEDGADFVEPDLVPTRDGVLVARHENNIAETTDVAAHPEFAGRRAVKVIDGERQDGWFTEDFTLAELKTLRAKERLGAVRPISMSFDGQFQIVSLAEIADFVAAEAAARGRVIGLIPEIKHSTYFNGLGFAVEDLFVAGLRASPYLGRAPVIVQSFEVGNLKLLRAKLGGMPGMAHVQLLQLIGDPKERPGDGGVTYAEMVTPAGLKAMAGYADWVSPNTRMIIPLAADGKLAAPSGLVEAAHAAGLLVSCWTFRPENRFLAVDFRDGAGDAARNEAGSVAEMRRYLATGLDAIFSDDPGLARQAVDSGV
jgi:glycerophosphoryl diester phosphodiesterase